VALRGRKVDVQLWITQGPKPLPLKYVIATKDLPAQPEYSVMLSHWDTTHEPRADVFTFRPSRGASQVDLGTLLANRPIPSGKPSR
jgi:hypothetical protein